jgi:two-component system, NtrC family, sensor kinase
MKVQSLKKKILLSFCAVIAVLGTLITALGLYMINKQIIERAQREVELKLKVARYVYSDEISRMKVAFHLAPLGEEGRETLKRELSLDYLLWVGPEDAPTIKSEIAREAFAGNPTGGTRIINAQELASLDPALLEQARIQVMDTPLARTSSRSFMDSTMAMEYAMPVNGSDGVRRVLYGGKIINRDFALIDKIHQLVYEDKAFEGKPIGTVTIFQDDVRIATNVVDKEGNRAVGTRVSARVYENVVEKGRRWIDRAFVVTDWYLTGYEPIKDIRGNIIGILYVGLLEKPFKVIMRNVFLAFLLIMACASALAVLLSFALGKALWNPVSRMLEGTALVAAGDLDHRVDTNTELVELKQLADAFNTMVEKLNERDSSIMRAQHKLSDLNKTYLDLVGFVAHELKGLLSSVILNAYSVRDGFLGMINFKQRKAMDQVTRNLDYLASTVRNFLSLSRIEKGELELKISAVCLKEDIFDIAAEEFTKQAQEKEMDICVRIRPGLTAQLDPDLFLIVANNLVTNAVKYGRHGGKIVVTAEETADTTRVRVYNDGIPLQADHIGELFKRFSRIHSPDTKKVQGTGLGLFITKEIVEKHGARIWIEPQPEGNAFCIEIARVSQESKEYVSNSNSP